MAILFRCPCGRSMVAEDDKVGDVIMCPNCHRNLKVPSGKGRGKALRSAPPAARPPKTRQCPRCDRDIPIEAQMCPHCNMIVMDAPGASTPAAGPRSPSTAPSGTSAVSGIRYGGSHASWWSQLSSGGRAAVIVSAVVAVVALVIIMVVAFSQHRESKLAEGRQAIKRALEEGPDLEATGEFDNAYKLYHKALFYEDAIADAGLGSEMKKLDRLRDRARALTVLVTKTRGDKLKSWSPDSRADQNRAQKLVQRGYPEYRQQAMNVLMAAREAAEAGAEGTEAAYDEAAVKVMDRFVDFVLETTPEERHLVTFNRIKSLVQSVGRANANWDRPNVRERSLKSVTVKADQIADRMRKELWYTTGDHFPR